LFKKEVNFLGNRVACSGLTIDSKKLSAIAQMAAPKNIKALRSTLGMFNFFRRLVFGYAKITSVFYDLLYKSENDYIWKAEHESAFQDIKQRMLSGPILGFYDASKRLYMMTNSSLFAVGYLIYQKFENKQNHLIACGGRVLTLTERKRSITDLECMALNIGINDNHSLLVNCHFTVYTDHYFLSFLKNLSNLNSRINRYACLIEGYNYEVKFKNGADNISDIISRLDNADQLKTSDDSVVKCNKNIPKIDFVFESKTNAPMPALQSPKVHEILSKITLLLS